MSNITKTFTVPAGLPYKVGVRSWGKEDLVRTLYGSVEDVTISRNDMQNYVLSGIDVQPVVGDSKAVIDFSNVKLPWKFEHSNRLLTSRFAIAPLGTTVTQPKYVKKFNGTTIGSPTITEDFVASGFSDSSYINTGYVQDFTNANTFEYVIKFTYKSSSSQQGIITGIGTSNGYTPFYVHDGNSLVTFISSNGSSWDVANALPLGLTLQNNVTYTLKATKDSTGYKWYNLVGGSWVLLCSLNNLTNPYSGLTVQIGSNRGKNNPFSGSIDLNECYIKVNGAEVWSGVKWVATEETETLKGCVRYYYGEGEHVTTPPRDSSQYYNIYAVNGDEGIVLDSTYFHEGTMVYNRPIFGDGEIPQFENEWYLGEYRVETGEEGYIFVPIDKPDTAV